MSLTAEDFALRRTGLTATDMAVLSGTSPYGRTPHDVYLDKLGLTEPTPQTTAMSVGHRLEPVALAMLAEERGFTIAPGKTERNPIMTLVIASPDGFVLDGPKGPCVAVAEAKAVGLHMARRWGESMDPNAIPDEVLVQVTWQCIAKRVSVAHVVALLGTEVRFYDVPKSDELAGALLETADGWWRRHVVRQIPPAVDGSDGSARMVQTMFRKAKRGVVPAPAEADGIVREYLAAKAALSESEAAARAAKTRLQALIGDAEGLESSEWIATWRERPGSPDWKQLAEKLGATPALVEEYRRAGPRVLSVRQKGTQGKAA